MKNLDLNMYGVQEMNHQEMMETDGGASFSDYSWAKLGLAYVGILVACASGVGAIAVVGAAVAVASYTVTANDAAKERGTAGVR